MYISMYPPRLIGGKYLERSEFNFCRMINSIARIACNNNNKPTNEQQISTITYIYHLLQCVIVKVTRISAVLHQ